MLSLTLISFVIFIEFEEHLKKTLILRGFDPYSPLYYLIFYYYLKLVSLEYVLTRPRVFQGPHEYVSSQIPLLEG